MKPTSIENSPTVAGLVVPGLTNVPTTVPWNSGVPDRVGFTSLEPSLVMNGVCPEKMIPSFSNWSETTVPRARFPSGSGGLRSEASGESFGPGCPFAPDRPLAGLPAASVS